MECKWNFWDFFATWKALFTISTIKYGQNYCWTLVCKEEFGIMSDHEAAQLKRSSGLQTLRNKLKSTADEGQRYF